MSKFDKRSYVSRIYPDHASIKNILYRLIRSNANKELVTGAKQTEHQLGSDNRSVKEIDTLFTWIENELPNAVDELGLNSGSNYFAQNQRTKVFKIAEYWGMYYLDDGSAMPHNHFPFPICFSYYINVPEGSSPFTIEGYDVPVEEGQVIFFRGDAEHQVKPSVNRRCMIAGNVIYNPSLPKKGFKGVKNHNKGF